MRPQPCNPLFGPITNAWEKYKKAAASRAPPAGEREYEKCGTCQSEQRLRRPKCTHPQRSFALGTCQVDL